MVKASTTIPVDLVNCINALQPEDCQRYLNEPYSSEKVNSPPADSIYANAKGLKLSIQHLRTSQDNSELLEINNLKKLCTV